ncbi:MAG TPA: hypothetical protein VKS60_23135 [Stellaceae bacterium]|nr:hypothetical protein [Stellaceae bacterium]
MTRRITLEQQSGVLAARRAELGGRVPSIPGNPGGRRTASKQALLRRLADIAAASTQPARFLANI